MTTTQTYTADEVFELALTEPFELINGELHIVPGSGQDSSAIGSNLLVEIGIYLKRHKIGFLTGEGGEFILSQNPDTVVFPDVGFSFNSRLVNGKRHLKFAPHSPDLAVEVMSPSDRMVDAEAKVRLYITAGTRLVWLVDPKRRIVKIYQDNHAPRILGDRELLTGDDVLPGFAISVEDVFKQPGE